MKFVSFHSHTTYSYGDGYGTVEQHVNRVHGLGMSALGLSEHGNVNSHAALEREANLKGIKPIFGIEAYLGPTGEKRTQSKTHLTIFAMNQQGYHNLNKLVTKSWIQHHYFPTISPSDLKEYNEGLVILSGCSDSLIPCTLLGGKFLGHKREFSELSAKEWDDNLAKVHRKLEWFTDVFDAGRFFLEVQRFPRLERTCTINQTFADLSRSTGIPLIATADVHYPFASNAPMQAMLHAARWPSTRSDFGSEAAWEFQANLSYPESDEEIIGDLIETGLDPDEAELAVLQTSKLANDCTVELPKARPLRYPGVRANNAILCGAKDGKFPSANDKEAVAGFAASLTLMDWIKKGWKRRKKQRPELSYRTQEYSKRVAYEYKIIADRDFSDYFLATADLVQYSKEQNVTVGPGRGSAAGSLICYLLGITEIDPLHPAFSRMIFERFIDPTRTDMPDIDLDFDDELRYKIPARAREIYGDENVANVSNHIKYRGRKALQDVCRAYSLPLKTFDEIAKRIADRVETDDRVDDSLTDVIQSYKSHPKIAALLDVFEDQIAKAILLEGNQHSMGTHAGGFVIASDPIPSVCPIYNKDSGQGKKKKLIQVIPYEKRDAEHLGLLKMDFLGLSTMGQIGLCRKWTAMSLSDLYRLFYAAYENKQYGEEENILQRFREDDCMGIFQYEGATTRQVVRDVNPQNFDELAACNALSRPGPLYGGQTSEYIAIKRGERDWERIHAEGFDRHVEWTYGQIVFQEQIMWILRDLAGFNTERVLKVRKIIGKKLGEFQFASLWAEFRDGCANNGLSEEAAEKVWRGITTAAGYAFNTSHSYAYALIAWWQMWFKIHHPTEFFAASLAKNGDTKDDLPRRIKLLQDAIEHGEIIADFDIKEADENWTCSKGVIYPGFRQIPNIGETKAEGAKKRIQRVLTSGGPVKDEVGLWVSLIGVHGLGEPTIMKMFEWVHSEDPFKIFYTSQQLNGFRKQLENDEFDGTGLPASENFVTSADLTDPSESEWVAWAGLVSNVHEKDEIEALRKKHGDSVEEAMERWIKKGGDPDKTKKCTLFAYDEMGEVALRVSTWVYDNLSGKISATEPDHHIVVVYGRTFAGRPNSIQVRNLWVLNPD